MMGLTVISGDFMSMSRNEIPCCGRPSELVRSEARSEPEPGSEYPWHHQSSALRIRGRKYSCCVAFANVISTGASILMENAFCGGAPMSALSSSKICCYMTFQPVPPKRSGHVTAPQPLL